MPPEPSIPCPKKRVRVLHLHLNFEYFDQINSGQKTREYRLVSKWKKKLEGKTFDEIHLYRGYPKRGSAGMTLYRRWNGMQIERRTHPHFGKETVEVYAIDVTIPA